MLPNLWTRHPRPRATPATSSRMVAYSMAFWGWMAVEGVFAVMFYHYLVPRSNQKTLPAEYRDYGRDRHVLLDRILSRLENTARANGESVPYVLANFLQGWFSRGDTTDVMAKTVEGVAPPTARITGGSMSSSSETSSTASCSSSSNSISGWDEDESSRSLNLKGAWTIPGLRREEMNEFFAWAFFGKEQQLLEKWERVENERCFQLLQSRSGLVFEPGRGSVYKPLRLSLENTDSIHRPLLVYCTIGCLKVGSHALLRMLGYQRVQSNSGLKGWYRPAAGADAKQLLPWCFFHGIAPGGLLFYLPMVLSGLVKDGRAVFLFENPNISCSMDFNALTEQETVDGVKEILDDKIGRDHPIGCIGHSFGSCPLTWLLHSAIRDRIRQLVLADPVTILLSEPDVMVNFLYSKDVSKIRMVASSELFTEQYLRRHFSWYNSELWLDSVPPDCRVLVVLSEKDEIINAPNVKDYIERTAKENKNINLLYWKGVGHANCVTSLPKWRELRALMLKQELTIASSRRS